MQDVGKNVGDEKGRGFWKRGGAGCAAGWLCIGKDSAEMIIANDETHEPTSRERWVMTGHGRLEGVVIDKATLPHQGTPRGECEHTSGLCLVDHQSGWGGEGDGWWEWVVGCVR